MNARCHCPLLVFCFVLLAFMGCKRKDAPVAGDSQNAAISAEVIGKALDAVTQGMREVSLNKVSTSNKGEECVVAAYKPKDGPDLGKTPPPLGMVRFLGNTVIYHGELDEVSVGSITIRAPYPTPGNYKTVEIAKEDIQSIHVKL